MLKLMTIPAPMGGVCGSWRHPDAWPPGDNLVMNLDHMISIAKTAERGKLDGIFFADGLGVHNMDYPEMFKAIIPPTRSEEHTSELQSLMRISYAVFCLKKKKKHKKQLTTIYKHQSNNNTSLRITEVIKHKQ